MDLNAINSMCNWEQDKALYLMKVAKDLGMNIADYGEIGVNNSSGNVYLWIEDYIFTLYMPINCELNRNGVWLMCTDPNDGEEYEKCLSDFDSMNTMKHIEFWVDEILEFIEQKENQ